MARQIDQAGIALIQSFESCKLNAYQDQVGVWTIGWGHTNGVRPDDVITQNQADDLFLIDIQKAENGVAACVKIPISDNQFAALVSFAFNLGLGALGGSTLLKLVNESDFQGAAQQFQLWDHAGGQVVAGLLRRRTAEAQLFSS